MNLNKEAILQQLNAIVPNTLLETLQISYTDVGEDFLTAKMPVNSSVHQPQGILHGGATVALAETVGSTASHLFIDTEKYKVKGLEISANHLKSKREGEVFATARPIHKGRTTHLWEIRIEDETGNLISLCKLTTIVLAK
ncbi:hotdog fold thioesterase [Kordia algicida OT-1]|uniref:Phenylacetic acid degradation-like protein n=1 Tax=Kordia algicida OT-1 TaxID=391587 RepID=A9DV08_9FLAO|nr:hotdog fold thioesterase [Kordia algicida]EDP96358.1 Phenylacetic acid degradation-like protein [Kordia algicida OT-1]